LGHSSWGRRDARATLHKRLQVAVRGPPRGRLAVTK
jgi:hypothetical protein